MSSNGVRFRIDVELPVGAAVELRVRWPAALPETLALELVLEGRVIRCGGNGMAVQTNRYAFGRRKMTAIRESKQPYLLTV